MTLFLVFIMADFPKKVKDWAISAGIIGKEPSLLPPGTEYALELRYGAPPVPLMILCEFPKGQDLLRMMHRTNVNSGHKLLVDENPDIRQQFIGKIFELSLLSNVLYNFHLGGPQEPYYWIFADELYFDGLTKDTFFARFRKIGDISKFFLNLFGRMFLKQEQGFDAKEFKPGI